MYRRFEKSKKRKKKHAKFIAKYTKKRQNVPERYQLNSQWKKNTQRKNYQEILDFLHLMTVTKAEQFIFLKNKTFIFLKKIN